MEFTVALVDHLAWPVVVTGALIGFRRSLRALIGRLDSWEGLGQKVQFGRKLVETGKQAELATSDVDEKLVEADQEVPLEVADRFSILARDATDNPSYSITAAWDELQGALRDLIGAATANLNQRGLSIRLGNEVSAIRTLRNRDYVNENFVSAVDGLRQLRNKVAHGQHKPTPDEAVSYVLSARELTRASEALANMIVQRTNGEMPPLG
ncbi:hypothetical protein AB0E63_12265 [Kribbella sp. NPDC026596]|uniref:hypothetical protein n=1 Tax=Kribbella sp. NPDC026596 TaxID=3155122 RepID=UPI0033D5DD27